MPAQAAPAAFSPHRPQPAYVHRDMDGAVKAFAAVQIVFAVVAIIGAFMILFSGEFAADAIEEEGDEPGAANLVRSIMWFLGFVLLAYGALGIAGSVGLFTLKGWGRGMSLAFCGISLIFLPFGTALGIWGLIVLTRPATAALFRQANGGVA